MYTFVGDQNAVVEGALSAAKVAFKLIDMTKHKGTHIHMLVTTSFFISSLLLLEGEHPRMGALDVCPFIPVSGVSMEECVQCSNEFGSRLAATIDVPVFLYEYSAKQEYRKTLPQIRSGEYEGLKDKV